jgi:MFS transporter, DHA1 family, inner membrane transport protein
MKYNTTKLDIASWSGFIIFAMSSVITPICLPEIIKTIPATLSESGSIETGRNIVVLIILIVASILVRLWSKQRFISQGQYLIALGLLFASFSQSYILFVLSLMIVGLGGGLTEAFLNPLIVDIHSRNSGKYLNLSNAFYPIGVMVSAFVFGELLTLGYSWRVIFRIAASAAILVAILFSILDFPRPEKGKKISVNIYGGILKNIGFWLFATAIFLAGGIESAFTFWGRTYVEKYFSDIPRAGAVAIMIFSASMAAGRLLTSYILIKFSLKSILMSSTLLGIGIGFSIPFATSLAEFYTLIAMAGLATACFWPTILAEARSCLDVNTTTLFILLASSGVVGYGITPWIMGIIGDSSNLMGSFLVVPFFFIGLLLIFMIEKKITNNNMVK